MCTAPKRERFAERLCHRVAISRPRSKIARRLSESIIFLHLLYRPKLILQFWVARNAYADKGEGIRKGVIFGGVLAKRGLVVGGCVR